MTATCKCGAKFDNVNQLREHIALLTLRWPARRCSLEHHDPYNEADVTWLTNRKDA